MKYLFFSLRPKHWVKNFFIFLPLIFGQKLFVLTITSKTVIAFFLFSLASSASYLINDIIDVEKDKLHPIKRLRPIASGKVSLKDAKNSAFILCILAIAFSFIFNIYFGWIVVCYLALNILYSKIFKKEVIIDVFCISAFFFLRLMAGSLIAEVELSHWIIIMIVLLALFLGFNKRRQELKILKHKAILHRQALAKYNLYFIDQMVTVITSSLVICYTLYTVDTRTVKEFGTNHLLYSIPFVYYGIFRYLYLIHKIRVDGDPIRVLFSDIKLRIDLLLWVAVCVAVIYLGI
ncbi:MAG: decaprenyl-phosphate phosphoribosyltransferase [Candidatus Omnitrophota bacterium]|nr:decaprenyl-phosphate phosphoribosyltransferase [Candidatus Omnitrophota bacterium]